MAYIPAAFRNEDPAALMALMRAHPLAVLASFSEGELHVSHLPLLVEEEGGRPAWLVGHFAVANPQARIAGTGLEAVAVFTGPATYVSPSWYATKAQTGKVVPTWNYAAVYVHGTLEFLDDHAGKHGVVSSLTDAREAAMPRPWAVDDAPEDFVAAQLRAVRGFRMRIRRIEGKWKMSQNRSEADRQGVVDGLAASAAPGAAAVHALMSGDAPGAGGAGTA